MKTPTQGPGAHLLSWLTKKEVISGTERSPHPDMSPTDKAPRRSKLTPIAWLTRVFSFKYTSPVIPIHTPWPLGPSHISRRDRPARLPHRHMHLGITP